MKRKSGRSISYMKTLCFLGICQLLLMTYSGEAQSSNQGSILIPAARYVFKNGETQQNVYVKRFYIDKYEVTWREFQGFMVTGYPGFSRGLHQSEGCGRFLPLEREEVTNSARVANSLLSVSTEEDGHGARSIPR